MQTYDEILLIKPLYPSIHSSMMAYAIYSAGDRLCPADAQSGSTSLIGGAGHGVGNSGSVSTVRHPSLKTRIFDVVV
jgi:hypothetical protein